MWMQASLQGGLKLPSLSCNARGAACGSLAGGIAGGLLDAQRAYFRGTWRDQWIWLPSDKRLHSGYNGHMKGIF